MRVMRPLSWRMRVSLQIRAMCRDQRGVSAIEFGMLVPVLILMYVGIVEMGNLLTVVRRVETIASTAADLTAQVKQVSNADLADIFAASTSILAPYDKRRSKWFCRASSPTRTITARLPGAARAADLVVLSARHTHCRRVPPWPIQV